MTDGGRLIPESFMDELITHQTSDNVWRSLMPPPAPPKPLTIRQRVLLRWWDVKWAVHDRLFGHHEDWDD